MELSSATRRLSWSLCLWLIVLAAFGLRVFGLNTQSLWYDEAFSVVVARADLAAAIRLMSSDVHPPLYYLILRVGIALWGSGEFAVRFVSLIPGVLLAPLSWALARRLFDRPTAVIAAALASLSPLLVWYAREARMYSQATAFGLAAAYALVRAQDSNQRRWWVAFAACALGAISSHYSAVYLVVALGVFWLTMGRREWLPGAVAFGTAAVGVLLAALHLLVFSPASQAFWPGRLDVASALIQGLRVTMGGHTGIPEVSDALAVLCGALALAAALGALVMRSGRRGVWLAVSVPLLGTALMFAVLYQRPKFEPRHLITLAPMVWVLVAAGVRALWRSRVTKAVAVLAVIALASGLAASDAAMFAGIAARDDWRGAVAYVQQNIRPDETLLLVSGHAFPALAYYGAPLWVALPGDPALDVRHVLDYASVAPALNRIQSEWRGVWLALWQDDIVDPTQSVPALLGDIGAELPVIAQFNGLRLRHFVIEHPAPFPSEPLMARRLDQSPVPGLTALGITLAQQPLPADEPLSVRMFWRADAAVRGAAGGSLRILDQQGQEWARRDYLLGGSFLSERWSPGQLVMGQYSITLPAVAPPGTYSLRQVVYRGEQTGVLDLGDVAVTRPLRALDVAALGINPAGLAHWGDLTLLLATLDQHALKPCEELTFALMWRCDRPPAGDYTVRAALAGQVAEQVLSPGLPTSQWRPGDVWRTQHHVTAPCRAPDGPADLQLTLSQAGRPVAAPIVVGTVDVQGGRVFAPPSMQHSFRADLGGQVKLLGYDLRLPTSDLRLPASGFRLPASNSQFPIELTLYWQATREMTTSLTVFTHVEGERVWGQHDGLPASGLAPTDMWIVGQVVADRHLLALDPATPSGWYRLVVGMYNPTSQTRLPAWDEKGARWPDDAVLLQEIAVAR